MEWPHRNELRQTGEHLFDDRSKCVVDVQKWSLHEHGNVCILMENDFTPFFGHEMRSLKNGVWTPNSFYLDVSGANHMCNGPTDRSCIRAVCVRLCVRLSVCPSVYPSASPSVCPSVCPSVSPSVCLSVFLCTDTDRHRHRPDTNTKRCTKLLVHRSSRSQNVGAPMRHVQNFDLAH